MRRYTVTGLDFALVSALLWGWLPQPGPVYPQSREERMNEEFQKAETSVDYKLFVEKYKPDELAFVAVQKLAKPYLEKKDWPGAMAVFQKYKSYFPGMEGRFDKIIDLLEAPEQGLVVKNLGDSVNTDKNEYCPIISADGKKLYFCRRVLGIRLVEGKLRLVEDEDIFVSMLDGEHWSKATSIGSPICTNNSEAPQGISADGNTMSLYGNYPGSLGWGDNFYAEKTAAGWSEVKHYPSPINTGFFDSDAMLTADGKAILFTSDRPGGIGEFHKKGNFFHGSNGGNIDIYICVKTDSGWSEAINLGETINTPYCEYTPFLHPDGRTLYFSSDGHHGLGGFDVFKATRKSDTSWTEWSEPINLGKEINGPDDDWGYRIATAGDLAYFSVYNRPGGYGGQDIYAIELPPEVKPLAVTTVSGKVMDSEAQFLEVQIKWNDLTLNKPAGEARSDPQTGKYFIALPAGHKYGYYAEKEGYIGKSEHLDLTDKKEYAEYTLDIVLYPVKKVTEEKITLRLNNIFFDVDEWQLREESFLELDRWVEFLKKNPEIRFEIHGHNDGTGTEAHNQWLSEKRAQSVVDYLVDKGIGKKRLTARGFGESRPVDTNETEEGRQNNRRVEIKFGEMAAK